MSVHVEVRGLLQVSFFKWHTLLFLRPDVSLNRELPSLGQQVPKLHLAPPSQSWAYKCLGIELIMHFIDWVISLALGIGFGAVNNLMQTTLIPISEHRDSHDQSSPLERCFHNLLKLESSEMFSYCCVAVFLYKTAHDNYKEFKKTSLYQCSATREGSGKKRLPS